MIKIGIVGYGNLGKGVEEIIKYRNDIELVGIFTRRDKNEVQKLSDNIVYNIEEILEFKDKIDVLILCGGSYSDLPVQGPLYIKDFNTVDSFDTHAKIEDYYKIMNEISINNNKVSIISIGWDPGIFSLIRNLFNSILPNSNTYSFWGNGVSQGHSDAIRKIDGVIDAIQYTIPIQNSIDKIRNGEIPILSNREKHIRECFVVVDENYDKSIIESKIKNMPFYFDEYTTTVNFIDLNELKNKHNKLFHGGNIISTNSINNNKNILELSLKLDSNPLFTASILVAYAEANYRLQQEKKYKAYTILDIPLSYIIDKKYYFKEI